MTTINGTPASSAAPVQSRSSLIVRPQRSRRLQLFTLAAAVDHLLRMDEINPSEPRSVERAVAACQSALGSFASYSTQGFRYFQARAKVVMPGRVTAGTVTVSGGEATASEGLPDWIDLATLRIGNHSYPVLGSGSGVFYVGSELLDGEYSGVFEQVFYPLPPNFRRRGTLADRQNAYAVGDLHPCSLQGMEDFFQWVSPVGADRSFSAITADSRFQGSLMLAVWPPFGERTELSLFYERYPDPAEVHREGGTGLVVSGTSAASAEPFFTERHLGAVLAVGVNNEIEFCRPLSSPSLLDTQRVITEVVSATEVTLDATIEGGVTDRAFYVSDVVDVMQGPMRDAYMRLCEYELLRQSNGKLADRKYREFMSQMRVAMADDMRYRESIDDAGVNWGGVYLGSVEVRPE